MTETIKYGEFFELIFSGMKLKIKALNTDKAKAENIISITAEVVDKTNQKNQFLMMVCFMKKIGL